MWETSSSGLLELAWPGPGNSGLLVRESVDGRARLSLYLSYKELKCIARHIVFLLNLHPPKVPWNYEKILTFKVLCSGMHPPSFIFLIAVTANCQSYSHPLHTPLGPLSHLTSHSLPAVRGETDSRVSPLSDRPHGQHLPQSPTVTHRAGGRGGREPAVEPPHLS